MKNGLVLEGGGMRGVYTSGVLDLFMDENIEVHYIIGVSAGACNGLSYVTKQRGRNKRVNIEYCKDPRYISYRKLLEGEGVFGMDFIFHTIPEQLIPFDYEAFYKSSQEFVVVTTDIYTGTPKYYRKNEIKSITPVVKGSSSLPFVQEPVEIEDRKVLDGGITDPIPYKKALEDGCDKIIVVLTRDPEYQKSRKNWTMKLAKSIYKEYPELQKALEERSAVYNHSLESLRKLENEGKALVIQPREEVKIKRIERNPRKLEELYRNGYQDAKNKKEKIRSFLGEDKQ